MTDAQQIEACIADIKAGLCCPRVHGCEQNDGEYCLVRQAFARTGLIADPDDEPSPSPPDGQLEPETKTGFASVNDAALTSIAISLKRIADLIEGHPQRLGMSDALAMIADRMPSQ
jgi:hypothetical protein